MMLPYSMPGAVESELPSVTLCTIARGSKPAMRALVSCVCAQSYPASLIEWVVLDDGDDKVGEDIFTEWSSRDRGARYVPYLNTVAEGTKKNRGMELATHDILIFMSDDNHYPRSYIDDVVREMSFKPEVPALGHRLAYRCDPATGSFFECTDERVHSGTLSVRVSKVGTRFGDLMGQDADEPIKNCAYAIAPTVAQRTVHVGSEPLGIEEPCNERPHLPEITRDALRVVGITMTVRERKSLLALDLHSSLEVAERKIENGDARAASDHASNTTLTIARAHILEHVRALEAQLADERKTVAMLRAELNLRPVPEPHAAKQRIETGPRVLRRRSGMRWSMR